MEKQAATQLKVGTAAAIALSLVIVASASQDQSALGAPTAWPWILTGLQVVALWSAGRRLWWGWLLGGLVQLPWIAYAVLTGQVGFVPGCSASACVQIYSFLQASPSRRPMEVRT